MQELAHLNAEILSQPQFQLYLLILVLLLDSDAFSLLLEGVIAGEKAKLFKGVS